MESRPALDGDPREVGQRVRRLREARGVSLSELARRAGIGKATLSGVETGQRNPTLETLWAITAQLGVPIAAILDTPAEPQVMYGAAVEATLLEVFEDQEVTYELYRLRVPPGTTQSSPAHHEGVTEHLTVFHGTLVAGPASAPLTAGPGDHISWTSDGPHTYRAQGPDVVQASLLIRYPGRQTLQGR
ncbi:helix-turn-helix domain-containing protein [Nonomuraea endophytica]|uniref:Transcriptional regulator with XRE-family HTH domain n=1 Tax=Nonomuraea endophytica TaxID=714136 RepID=A0A7W7ZWV1_9ACTN|nr:XRE family transcriptional regulator [Nonomuraea endophytica]MBB5075270.1 transcriptional regulator with XRE-family HTH domain [Nonomuraea endophytica]